MDLEKITTLRRATRFVQVMAVTGILILGALCGAAYFLFVKLPGDLAGQTADGMLRTADGGYALAKKIGKDFLEVLQFTPKITMGGDIVVFQKSEILELATASRSFHVNHVWEHTWLGSVKHIELEGEYVAKAVFDLNEEMTVDVDGLSKSVTVSSSEPRLLSLELKSYKIVKDEDGWWNKVTGVDRESAFEGMQMQARNSMGASEILEEARKSLQSKIEGIIRRHEANVIFDVLETKD